MHPDGRTNEVTTHQREIQQEQECRHSTLSGSGMYKSASWGNSSRPMSISLTLCLSHPAGHACVRCRFAVRWTGSASRPVRVPRIGRRWASRLSRCSCCSATTACRHTPPHTRSSACAGESTRHMRLIYIRNILKITREKGKKFFYFYLLLLQKQRIVSIQ